MEVLAPIYPSIIGVVVRRFSHVAFIGIGLLESGKENEIFHDIGCKCKGGS